MSAPKPVHLLCESHVCQWIFHLAAGFGLCHMHAVTRHKGKVEMLVTEQHSRYCTLRKKPVQVTDPAVLSCTAALTWQAVPIMKFDLLPTQQQLVSFPLIQREPSADSRLTLHCF